MHPARATILTCLLLATTITGCLGGDEAELPGEPDGAGTGESLETRLTPEDRTASEVSIAADPTDPAHLVAAANSDGETDGFGVYTSFDAGDGWDASLFEASRVPAGMGITEYEQISDPVVAFGPDGTTYLAGLALVPASAIFVAVSEDGGRSFETVHVVHESDPVSSFNDKEWLGVNPATGTLVMAWQREPAVDQLRAIEQAGGPDVDVGDVVVSRSTDGGQTWSDPLEIDRGMHNNGTQIAFTRGGTVHVAWVNYEQNTLDHVVSTDDAETFSDPEPIADVQTVPPFPRYSRMHTLPAVVSDPQADAVYAVWHDARNGDADVLAVASSDAGRSWSEPVRVNDDQVGNGAIQIYPWAAVAPDGSLHVTFYDSREDAEHPRFRVYHARAPGPSLAFGPNEPASGQPFTAFESPNGTAPTDEDSEHTSMGDYTGLAASSAGVFPAWADGRDGPAAIYAARLPT